MNNQNETNLKLDFSDINSSQEFFKRFPDEQTCIEHLKWLIWRGEPQSPYDETSEVYECKNGRYKCKNTGKCFTIFTKTIFKNTKISLLKWFYAIFLINKDKRGVTSVSLVAEIGVTQKTAWKMLHAIRKCMDCENYNVLDGEVELDEAYVGGKNRNRHKDKRVQNSQGRSYKDKTPVFGMLQRNGNLTALVVPDVKTKTLTNLITKYIKRSATLYTDEWLGYKEVAKLYRHDLVEHGKGQYVKDKVYTNSMEGGWHILKREISSYICVSRKHLQNYVNEFVFRYNRRRKSNTENFFYLLQNVTQVITYKDIVNGYS